MVGGRGIHDTKKDVWEIISSSGYRLDLGFSRRYEDKEVWSSELHLHFIVWAFRALENVT